MADEVNTPLEEETENIYHELTDEELDIEIEITQAVLDQIDRMIAENIAKIAQDDDPDGRTRLNEILTMEKEFKITKMTLLEEEKESRENEPIGG